MLIWMILFVYAINANQMPMRQMNFRVLSNSYFNTTDTSSIVLQQTIRRSGLASISCSQLCINIGSTCTKAVYNNLNHVCTIYNTTIGIQQKSSCCTTFINSDIDESVIVPTNPQVSNASNLFVGRRSHTATLLNSGRVLITGGRNYSIIFSSCELYFPEYQNWSVVASMNTPRARHTATLLTANNIDLVFVIGGYYTTSSNPLSSVEYYTSSSNIWTIIANSMNNARFSHSTTILKDGRFLVAAGANLTARLTSSEIFDPNTLTWQMVGSLNNARSQHMNTLLDNGNVFIARGINASNILQSCEIFDINLQTLSVVQSLTYPRNLGSLVSLLTITNSILITGGQEFSGIPYSTTDLYYPSTNSIIPSSNMNYERFAHSSNLMYYEYTPLIIATGGYNSSNIAINSVELFIITNSTWINIQGMNTARGEHTATLLNTSPPSLLIVDGRISTSATSALNSVELFIF